MMSNLFENLQLLNERNNTAIFNYLKNKFTDISKIYYDTDDGYNKVEIRSKVHPIYDRFQSLTINDDIRESYDNLSDKKVVLALEDVIKTYMNKRVETFNLLKNLNKINVKINNNVCKTYKYKVGAYNELIIWIKSIDKTINKWIWISDVYKYLSYKGGKSQINVSELNNLKCLDTEKANEVIQSINNKQSFNDIDSFENYLKGINVFICDAQSSM